MKMMKKLLAVILILSMVLGMTVTAMADGENQQTGSIKILNTTANVTYNLYKIFDIEVVTSDGNVSTYFYKPTENWKNFFIGESSGGVLYGGPVNENGYIEWRNTNVFLDTASFAVSAKGYVQTNTLTADVSVVTDTGNLIEETRNEEKQYDFLIEGLDATSYYLIISSVGTEAMAGPIQPGVTQEITEKNEAGDVPLISKTVGEDGATQISVDIGQEYRYTVDIILKRNVPYTEGTVNMVLNDTLPMFITTSEPTITVKHAGHTEEITLTAAAFTYKNMQNVTETIVDRPDTKQYTNIIEFHREFHANDEIKITYTGVLGCFEDNGTTYSPIVRDVYTNKAELIEGGSTVRDTASVFTLPLYGKKYYSNEAGNAVALGGAEFILQRESDALYYKVDAQNNAVEWVSDDSEATVVTSATEAGINAVGDFSFYGIAAGNYKLIETKAPDGFTGAKETSVAVNRETKPVEVENVKGAAGLLPSTGGMGTTMLYVAGAVLILGAGVMMVARKKQTEEE